MRNHAFRHSPVNTGKLPALFALLGAGVLTGCNGGTDRGSGATTSGVSTTGAATGGDTAASMDPTRDAVEPAPASRFAWFGDLHLHTGYSFDAAASGTNTTPDDAYRYARGESVEYLGRDVQRLIPLDFLAVTDHAEYLGVANEVADPDGRFANSEWPARLAAVAEDTLGYLGLFSPSAFRGSAPPIDEFLDDQLIRTNWQRQIDAAERYYEPGTFTTLVGFEWSPMPGGAHLHRNVIFRGPDYPLLPYSALDSARPEDLWSYVETLRAGDIDSVLIPHNSNMSQGLMFATTDSFGDPITAAYAERRILNERLVEIAQNKGTSETRPEFSPADEFAGFELLDLAAEEGADPAGGYLRQALARGLEIEEQIGVNPFVFGIIGSTDFHSGVSSTEENNFPGGLGRSDDIADPERVLNEINPIARAPSTIFTAGALTGVWAEANTRESIFAALQRREAFATSGSRLRLRMFAGWEFEAGLTETDDWVQQAYEAGYAMGADLPDRGADSAAPFRLLVQAVKDPDGANLDRIQIVKISRANGMPREEIFDVAWSDGRVPDPSTGRLPPVGDTVDLSSATYSNDIGAVELKAEWVDDDFDPAVPAIYYARALEIPTPRWSTYLAVRNGLEVSAAVPATLQERAWSSPVFYSPNRR